ncbi:MAG: hypothetical protein R3C45_02075 [Phycisphaerales bacterium]
MGTPNAIGIPQFDVAVAAIKRVPVIDAPVDHAFAEDRAVRRVGAELVKDAAVAVGPGGLSVAKKMTQRSS